VLSNDTECQFSIRILPKPDVRAKYSVMEAVGFDMESPGCPVETGNILLEVPGRGQVLVPLAALAPGTVIETPTLRLFVESVTRASSVKLAIPVQAKIAAVVAKGYSMAFPVLVALGAIGLLLATFFRTKHPAPILALGLASAVAIGDRITLLAYIDASSFPAASVLYGSPASPFVTVSYTHLGLSRGSGSESKAAGTRLLPRNPALSSPGSGTGGHPLRPQRGHSAASGHPTLLPSRCARQRVDLGPADQSHRFPSAEADLLRRLGGRHRIRMLQLTE